MSMLSMPGTARDAARGNNNANNDYENGCNQLPKSMETMLVIIARRQEQPSSMDQHQDHEPGQQGPTPTPWTKHH
ncbi:hypothetical protein ACLKA7_003097 [Drosophila subpalustris]